MNAPPFGVAYILFTVRPHEIDDGFVGVEVRLPNSASIGVIHGNTEKSENEKNSRNEAANGGGYERGVHGKMLSMGFGFSELV